MPLFFKAHSQDYAPRAEFIWSFNIKATIGRIKSTLAVLFTQSGKMLFLKSAFNQRLMTRLIIDMFDFTQIRAGQLKSLRKATNKATALRVNLKQMEVLQGFNNINEIAKPALEFGHYYLKLMRFTANPLHLALQHNPPPGKQVPTFFLTFDKKQANNGIGY